MESEEFMLLPANQLIDIISSDELNVRSEEQVFNAVMAWVKYSIQERRPQLPQVIIGVFCLVERKRHCPSYCGVHLFPKSDGELETFALPGIVSLLCASPCLGTVLPQPWHSSKPVNEPREARLLLAL